MSFANYSSHFFTMKHLLFNAFSNLDNRFLDPYLREEKSSIDEPMIVATKRGHVKFQSPGNSNSSPEADDDQKRGPKNSSRDKDSDELPSTLFKVLY